MLRKIRALLLAGERKKMLLATASSFINVVLDLAGIAALLPVLYFLLERDGSLRTVVLFCAAAFLLIVLKCVSSIVLTRYQNSVLLALYRRLSCSMYCAFYRRGLLFVGSKGVNRIGYEVNSVCYSFSQGLLAVLMRMFGDLLFILVAMALLLIWSPGVSLVLLASFIPYTVVYVFAVRRQLGLLGEREQAARRGQWELTADTFEGWPAVETTCSFPHFASAFRKGTEEISDARLKMSVYSRLPLFLSELAAASGICLMALCGDGDVRVVVGVFALAAFRLLPALRSVVSGWTQVKNLSCTLDIISEALQDDGGEEDASVPCPSFRKELRLEDIRYTYPDGEKVLDGFSMLVAKGEYLGIKGFSGSGKTTLFNLLLGFLEPDSGMLYIDGKAFTQPLRRAFLSRVGYVPQEVHVFSGSLLENIALGDPSPDRKKAEELLEAVGLSAWLEKLPSGLDTPVKNALSGGQRQRLGIARALYRDIDLLLLDEATSALDNDSEAVVNKMLLSLRKERGLTVVSIAHRESSLSLCDRVISIK